MKWKALGGIASVNTSNGPKSVSTPPKLLDRVRSEIRTRHYSLRTEQAYVGWIKRFILFHGKRHPREMSAPEIEGFLSDLAVRQMKAVSRWPQAVS